MEVIARLGKEKEEVDRRTGNKTLLIKDQTGMDFASSARAAENRTRWKEIVTKARLHVWDRIENNRENINNIPRPENRAVN